jgi:predicted transcriptional regulator
VVNGGRFMTVDVDEDFLYVTNSLRRIDVMYVLVSVDFARNYEIADILCISSAHTSIYTKGLEEHDLVESKKVKNYKVYSLTDKGRDMLQKLKDYHGIE